MRRRVTIGGKASKARRKSTKSKRRNAPAVGRRKRSSDTDLRDQLDHSKRELNEALARETANAEVLKVISGSLGELDRVFQAMLENAVRLCKAKFAMLFLYEANEFRAVGKWNLPPAWAEWLGKNPIRADPVVPLGRAVMTKQPVHITDVLADQAYIERYPGMVAVAELGGARTLLQVPMLKKNEVVGTIGIYSQEVRPFTDKQSELVKNFAAQAVIAIENARLLNELNELNQQLGRRVADQVGEIERMGRLRRFLPPQVADLIVASGTEKQLESHRREITALFCDLRGFTGFSESSDPEDVMALLPRLESILLHSASGDGYNDLTPLLAI